MAEPQDQGSNERKPPRFMYRLLMAVEGIARLLTGARSKTTTPPPPVSSGSRRAPTSESGQKSGGRRPPPGSPLPLPETLAGVPLSGAPSKPLPPLNAVPTTPVGGAGTGPAGTGPSPAAPGAVPAPTSTPSLPAPFPTGSRGRRPGTAGASKGGGGTGPTPLPPPLPPRPPALPFAGNAPAVPPRAFPGAKWNRPSNLPGSAKSLGWTPPPIPTLSSTTEDETEAEDESGMPFAKAPGKRNWRRRTYLDWVRDLGSNRQAADAARRRLDSAKERVRRYREAPQKEQEAQDRLDRAQARLNRAKAQRSPAAVVRQLRERRNAARRQLAGAQKEHQEARRNWGDAKREYHDAKQGLKNATGTSGALAGTAKVLQAHGVGKKGSSIGGMLETAQLAARAYAGDPTAVAGLVEKAVEAMPTPDKFMKAEKTEDILKFFGAMPGVLGDAIGSLRDWSDALHASNMQFVTFSASMAAIQAQMNVREAQLAHNRGERRAGSAALLAENRQQFLENTAVFEDVFADFKAGVLSGMMEVTNEFLKPMAEYAKRKMGWVDKELQQDLNADFVRAMEIMQFEAVRGRPNRFPRQ